MWVTLRMLFCTHVSLADFTLLLQFSSGLPPNTVSFPQICAVEIQSILHACDFMDTHTTSSLGFAVASSLGTGLIKSLEKPLPLDRYCFLHHALPFCPDRRLKIPEDCQGKVRCSHGESHDCSVWVVQRLCLVSQSHGVADLLHQSVSCFSQLNKTLYIP
jgi:hypothetical protein